MKVGTGPGEQAPSVGAGPDFHLLLTGGGAELRRRPAHVVDIAPEIRFLHKTPGFLQDGCVAPCLDDPALNMTGHRGGSTCRDFGDAVLRTVREMD